MQNKADRIFYGTIYTADAAGSTVSALAVAEGKVLYAGSREGAQAFKGTDTVEEEVPGMVIPAMTEGHAHVTCSLEMICGLPLGMRERPEEYLNLIRDYAAAHPELDRIYGSGYDNGVFGTTGPTAALLDSVCSDRPVVMVASDHHSRWLNTKALELCGITRDTPNPRNGEVVRDGSGNPTGWLKEMAMRLANPAVPKFTEQQYAEAVKYFQNIALSQGVANVFEPEYDPLNDYETKTLGWNLLDRAGELYLTGRLGWTIETPEEIPHTLAEMKRVGALLNPDGHVQLNTAKFFVDGVVECHTAYLREDYCDAPGDRGNPIMTTEEFTVGMTEALAQGFDIHVHVIGDAASDVAIDALEKAQKASPRPDGFRNALTHLQVLHPDQIQRMAALEIGAVVNPYWHYSNPVYYDTLEKPYLGEKRAKEEYPVASFRNAGIRMSQASDFPVTVPPASMVSLHLMVNRRDPEHPELPVLNPKECLTVREALDVLTIGGARQLRLENRKGSLEPGKDADFVILDRNVFTISPADLAKTRIQQTWIAGVRRY